MYRRRSRVSHATSRLLLETLESRRVLATVTLNTDLGIAGELRTEIANAAAGETIDFNLAVGTETITLVMGELLIDKPLTIDGRNLAGTGGSVTINAVGASRVLNINDGLASMAAVSLNDLTITGGNSVGDPTSETGGGIRNAEDLTLSMSTITGNVGRNGGGLGNVGGRVAVTDTVIEMNTANGRGGGVHNTLGGYLSITRGDISANTATLDTPYASVGGGVSSYGTGSVVMLTDSTVTGNSAVHDDTTYDSTGLGGGLANDYYSAMTLSNTVVSGNYADFGGGGWVDDGAELDVLAGSDFNSNTAIERGGGLHGVDGAIIEIGYSSFTGNGTTTTGTGDGGAISVGSLVSLSIDNSTINNNYAYDRGGAIYASSFGIAPGTMVTITDSTFSGNTAIDDGGAISTGQLAMTTISGTTLSGNSVGDDGGAIHSSGFSFSPGPTGAALTILDSMLTGNLAGGSGGAMRSSSSITTYIKDTLIQGNSSTSRGGAIYTRGEANVTYSYTGSVTIRDSVVTQNTSLDDGAGIHGGRATETTVDNTDVTNNVAYDRGGGFRLSFANAYASTTTVTDSRIQGNMSSGSGGGLYIAQSQQVTIENTTIDSNTSYGSGAGFVAISGSATTLRGSTVSNGYGLSTGGGIDVTNAFFAMEQSTVTGNSTVANGGGLYLRLDAELDPSLTLNIEGATITQNYGISGGGVYNFVDSVSSIRNSIISGNSDSGGLGADLREAGTVTLEYNLVGDNENTTLAEANPDANGNIVGGAVGGVIDADLGPLADNGGPTLTHLPNASSPAIDAGDPLVAGGTDQRGFQRVVDGDVMGGARVDMGATEFGSSLTPSGDFDGNQLWECADIDALVAEIVAGTNNPSFDMNTDGVVNLLDITDAAAGWLRVAGEINLGAGKAYLVGDANLDGFVNGQDFVIWNTFKFSGGNGWCGGDFNASGQTDGQDFVLWNSNKFMASDASAAADQHPESTAERFASRRGVIRDETKGGDIEASEMEQVDHAFVHLDRSEVERSEVSVDPERIATPALPEMVVLREFANDHEHTEPDEEAPNAVDLLFAQA